MAKSKEDAIQWAVNQQYQKIEFPLTNEEITTFGELLRSFDLGYFEGCLNASCVREEDIEKIAIVKYWLNQFNDVIASRINFLEEYCKLELPTGEDIFTILEKYGL